MKSKTILEAVHKRRPQPGERGVCSVRTRGGGRGSSDADVRTLYILFGAKIFEIYGVSARTRGLIEPVRTRREGSIFRNFVRTSLMDGPLNKVHYYRVSMSLSG